MNITHEKQLYNIGKRLYIKRKENNKSSCMTFGFTCGDGWFEPIKKLTISLEKINDELKSYKSNIEAEQVKEKFGKLTFYFNLNEKKLFREFYIEKKLNENIISYIKKNNKAYFLKYLIMFKLNILFLFLNKIIKFINFLYLNTKKQISEGLENEYYNRVNNEIRIAEEECYNICEICGCMPSGEEKIIETTGWIRRICKQCNKKRNANNV